MISSSGPDRLPPDSPTCLTTPAPAEPGESCRHDLAQRGKNLAATIPLKPAKPSTASQRSPPTQKSSSGPEKPSARRIGEKVRLAANFTETIVGRIVGHRSAATTRRYEHLRTDPLREAVEQIGTGLAGDLERRDAEWAQQEVAPSLST